MKKTLFSATFLTACTSIGTDTLATETKCDWQERGERWGESQKIQNKKINENLTLFGSLELSSLTVKKNLTCYGSATLSHVKVQGVTTMFGCMTASSCRFEDIDVRSSSARQDAPGSVSLTSCSAQKCMVSAQLDVQDSTIDTLVLFSYPCVLKNTRIKNLVIMNTRKQPLIELIDTVIEGTVTFAQKGGCITQKGSSKIKGSLVNGTLE
jgi:hypothetical protein